MLTKWDEKGQWWLPGVKLSALPPLAYGAIAKLHRYEMTLLEPDNVIDLLNEKDELAEENIRVKTLLAQTDEENKRLCDRIIELETLLQNLEKKPKSYEHIKNQATQEVHNGEDT